MNVEFVMGQGRIWNVAAKASLTGPATVTEINSMSWVYAVGVAILMLTVMESATTMKHWDVPTHWLTTSIKEPHLMMARAFSRVKVKSTSMFSIGTEITQLLSLTSS